jgi:diguanylate cyclase
MVSPGEFIPLAEHTGLIRPLTDWVLGEAVAQAARWEAAGLPLRVAVNISSRSLLEERFAEGVAALLLRHRVKPALLELEITESVLLADPEKAERVLNELDTFGVRLSIDDFGTGYSSLGYLKRLPVHVLKIDRSFVSDMIASASDHAIVASTVTLSRNLDLEVVAEGVEDDATMVELSRLGCHMAQGFGISRPVPAADLDAWMRRGLTLPKELGERSSVRPLSSAKSRR